MTHLTRRYVAKAIAALAVGGMVRADPTSGTVADGSRVRQPATGQSWRYARHDLVTGTIVNSELDSVIAVGRSIEIGAHSETTKEAPIIHPDWGSGWLRKYMGGDRPVDPHTNEIQEPWGMVLIDPHWSQLQSYREPIPLWPMELRPGWSTTVATYYRIPDSQEEMPWQLTMHAHKWESITVPAGRFTALRFTNLINFRYTNISGRVAGQRKENIWFAPEIGRWVMRESSGTFRQDVAEEFNESSYRWELLSWS